MDLILERTDFKISGIFGELWTDEGELSEQLAFTLEHSYMVPGQYLPKLPTGSYKCVRGEHQLHPKPGRPPSPKFETFEVTNVPGHTGILFHPGNFNTDSDGCILLGEDIKNGMITNSRDAFKSFMEVQFEVNEFTLTVQDTPSLTNKRQP